MTENTDVIQVRLQDLRRRFILRMLSDRQVLFLGWEMRDYQGMRECAHKLAGIAASFGFEDIGYAAADLQSKLDVGSDELSLKTAVIDLLTLIDNHKSVTAQLPLTGLREYRIN